MTEQIGCRIRKLRSRLGVSQNELAENLCSQSNISKIEKGLHAPSLYLLTEFAARLGVSVETLYSENETRNFEDIKRVLYRLVETQNYEQLEHIASEYPDIFESNYEKKMIYWIKSIVARAVEGNVEKARRLIRFCLDLKSEVEDHRLEMGIMNAEAILFRDVYSDKKISEVYRKMFKMIEKNNLRGHVVIKTLLSISTHYYHQRKYERVIEISNHAVEMLTKEKCMYLLDYHLYNIGSSMYYLGIYDEKSERQLRLAGELAWQNGNYKLLKLTEEIIKMADESCISMHMKGGEPYEESFL